ncbi:MULTISPECIES: PQQ-binding-like beta-propeller repeat protein [unclassified Spirosoma]|uniref:outer membrane protein assembly factor BamB family protein n=1 Tax=unclassified Spirosoma TaxID=2621999 RepID=UPI0009659EC5|nr:MULTISPECIES: PQQ-binding-like beta-propeller repeat protein [unclassified Spirosoma]MBN8824499.1 PQQ-binding-like beta-propeller repeat protein [Spirosoma sp.]OJW70871.1 MAG: pyrrolo-quinoline quinone [Spirosoma sp. 48-14]
MKRFSYLTLLLSVGLLSLTEKPATTDWPEYNGGPDRNHFSPLTQLNPGNVAGLKVAWEYASGGVDTLKNNTQIQCNPLIIDGVLYGVSAGSQAFALDAATGKQLWKTNFTDDTFAMNSRGVTYWTDGRQARIYFAYGSLLYALDARTGKPVASFGKGGKINLKEGLARPGADEYVVSNTPGVVYKNLLIMGHRVSEIAPALPGDVRAYDLHTGRIVWTFHTIPHPGEYGADTWPKDGYRNFGGANNWMGMAIDRQRGIVYVPTGTAAFDLYGSTRPGQNLFGNSLIALDATTGKRLWHFQTIHHDIWDRDIPAPPNLFTVVHDGKKVDAVSVLSKQGFLFVFDRVTGKPLFPIEERPMPASTVPGEKAWPTQPIPLKPAPFTRQSFSESDINDFVTDRDTIVAQLRRWQSGKEFIPLPLSPNRTVFFPGTDGGAQWGGAAVDEAGIMYVPAKQIPVTMGLVPTPASPTSAAVVDRTGSQLYQTHCASCHGQDREGSHDGSYPALIRISQKRNETSVAQVLAKGQGMMPAFTHLKEAERRAIVDFLFGKTTSVASKEDLNTSPYHHTGFTRWYDRAGYPVSRPPWGTLTAIDMNTGEHRWQVPLGEYPELVAKGVPPTGTDNYGAPAVTAGGLLFIASSRDELIRAFDRKTGRELWRAKLPAAGYASPSTYAVNGKQYVVIACGGGKLKTKSGDRYVAFALP